MSENPDKTREEVERDEKGRLIPGQKSLNPKGRPKGSISFMSRIKRILEEDPDRFEELCEYYINDKRMRELLLKMVDGMPRQGLDVGLDDDVKEIQVKIVGDNEDTSDKSIQEES